MTKVVYVTGTRADYGKIKPLIRAMYESAEYEVHIYICGMHLLAEYGNTYEQVLKDNLGECYVDYSIDLSSDMDSNLGNTISCFSAYIHKICPDYIVVHGDRIDALAGAMVGMLNNIRVVHIEGGELTGTVDDSIRHAVSKLSHIHMTANEETRSRLMQLGEAPESIHVIGSPDIDIMLSEDLPGIDEVKARHQVGFEEYGIFIYHPVVTEVDMLDGYMDEICNALIEAGRNYIIIYPNNDMGSDVIIRHLDRLLPQVKAMAFKSVPFEDFLTLLKNSSFILGNSSAGIREACVYGVPCINIGTRQNRRFNPRILKNIQSVDEQRDEIVNAIDKSRDYRFVSSYYGHGNSAELFMRAMNREINRARTCDAGIQKHFIDSNETKEKIRQFINEGCE